MLFDDDANVGFFLRYFVEEVRYYIFALADSNYHAIIRGFKKNLKRNDLIF